MAMNDTEIKEELRSYFITNSLPGAKPMRMDDDDSFFENGVIDSTGVLELVFFLEEKYKITIEDEEVNPENLDSINRLIQFIHHKKDHPNP